MKEETKSKIEALKQHTIETLLQEHTTTFSKINITALALIHAFYNSTNLAVNTTHLHKPNLSPIHSQLKTQATLKVSLY